MNKGLLRRPAAGPVTQIGLAETEHMAQEDWTARDLLDMGMGPEVAARTLQLLENAI